MGTLAFSLQGSWWPHSVTYAFLFVAVALIVCDIFIVTDILAYIGYALVAIALTELIHVSFSIRLVVAAGVLAAAVWFHFALWQQFGLPWVSKHVSPRRYRDGAYGLMGRTARVKEVENECFVEALGDLWRFTSDVPTPPGSLVEILSTDHGILHVRPLEKK